MMRISKIIKTEDGQSSVLAAVALIAITGFAALVMDMGMLYLARSNMQTAADAAALAGAQDLPAVSDAVSSAKRYAQLNGIEVGRTTVVTPYNGDPNQIEVVCTRVVKYSFARILGFSGKEVSVRAVAEKIEVTGNVFDYALFSGDPNYELTLNGSKDLINGNAHSNDRFKMNGSFQQINGNVEAVSQFEMNGSKQTITGVCQAASIKISGSQINVPNRIQFPAPWVDMPDFSALIQTEAEAAGQAYSGNKTYSGSFMNVDHPIYVDGDLTVNGSHFNGNGVVLVSGDIVFNGSNLRSSGSSVCFYSKNGDITINGSGSVLEGMVYAPNGKITMNGAKQTVYGRVIGYQVVFNGSQQTISATSDDLNSLPQTIIRLVE